MKKSFGLAIWPAAVAATMMFAACGSDDNSSNVEREEGSSSSVEATSSSSEESSSSEKREVPEGTRAATLDDLQKNMALGKMFGSDIYLATGAKLGVFSIWIPDTAWIAVHSEFKDGVLEYGKSNGSIMATATAVSDSLTAFFEKGGKIEFVVKGEKLQYSINGGDYADVEKADVKTSSNWLSDGTKLQGVRLSCKNDDAKQTYSFYKGRYVVEESIGDSSFWSAGFYDIQRSHLLMTPVFFNKSAYSLVSGQVSSDFNLSMDTGAEIKCEKTTFKFDEVDRDSIANEWVADADGVDWTMKLKTSGEFTLDAVKGKNTEDFRSGIWDIYGDILLLKNSACHSPSKCAKSMKGAVEGFDPQKGFTYKHDDSSTPVMPKDWTLPQYE